MHEKAGGKIAIESKVSMGTQDDLSLAYTLGVAGPCKAITDNPEAAYDLTWKGNSVAIVSDGSAVLGLGNIGPLAGLPVIEGKAALLRDFAAIDAVPLCIDYNDPEKIISFVKAIEPTFGAICLEDIRAPQCVKIERRLRMEMGIPVFHDDQHGTAIVVAAALTNAAKVVGKEFSELTVVIRGTGAEGSAIINMLHRLGIKEIYAFNEDGIVTKKKYDQYDFVVQELSKITNLKYENLNMAKAMERADVFIDVSVGDIVTKEMVAGMKSDPIVFAMANPTPEISYEAGMEAGAKVMATGIMDYPNQINKVLASPGIFRGVLDCKAKKITNEMEMAAVNALVSLVSKDELCAEYIIPKITDYRVVVAVSEAVMAEARKQGVARC